MVLFESDWARYPTAIPDFETKNKSWVHLAQKYHAMGIRNCLFILALINPDLQGIDPHSKNLTQQQKYAVAMECRENPWYFFREVARAPGIGKAESGPVEANRGNIALWWSFFNHVTIILTQIRQTGKSFSTDCLMTYLLNVVCDNTQINLVTKDDTLRKANIERMKSIAADLPLYLLQRTKNDANNAEEITTKDRTNFYKTHVPQPSKKLAYNMGRGLTSPIMQFDEAAFQPNISISLPAALAATGAAVDAARDSGTPYGTIITTTAGKKDDPDGAYIYDLVERAAIWDEKLFFDCSGEEELVRIIKSMSRPAKDEKKVTRVIVNATFNHRQLGKDDAWLEDKIARSLQTADDANRDFFNMWTSGGVANPLPTYILDIMRGAQKEASYVAIHPFYGYCTRWYIPAHQITSRMANGNYVMSLDTSDAVARDDIGMVIMDAETLEIVAAGTYNETNLLNFAHWLTDVIVQFPTMLTIIERKSSGAMMLDSIAVGLQARGIDPFKRLFNWVVNNSSEDRARYEQIAVPIHRREDGLYEKYKKHFGFGTSSGGETSRNDLYGNTLQQAAKHSADRLFDVTLINQVTGLTSRNGRIDHSVGGHDDMVISWLLAYWVLSRGKNLQFYGFDTRRIMSRIGNSTLAKDEAEIQTRIEQQLIREQIKEKYDQLAMETNDVITMRLEHELRMLDKKVVLEVGEVYSVNQLIQQASETRQARRRVRDKYIGISRDRSGPNHLTAAYDSMNGQFSATPYDVGQTLSRWR